MGMFSWEGGCWGVGSESILEAESGDDGTTLNTRNHRVGQLSEFSDI